VRVFFGDDSKQDAPSRAGMGPLVAIGGVHVGHAELYPLQRRIDALCKQSGFPTGEPFKWSPGKELWMYDHLKDAARNEFFRGILNAAQAHGVGACIVIEDKNGGMATKKVKTHELDGTRLFLERADMELGRVGEKGMVVVDRPGGGLKDQEAFLGSCVDALQEGTDYWKKAHTAFVVSGPSKFLRLLQLADVVVGSTLAYVAGEAAHAPETFQHVRPMLATQKGRVGGNGVKIHPDSWYANLYHWLFGDSSIRKKGATVQLPSDKWRYLNGPDKP
jgi:hypothetical protein